MMTREQKVGIVSILIIMVIAVWIGHCVYKPYIRWISKDFLSPGPTSTARQLDEEIRFVTYREGDVYTATHLSLESLHKKVLLLEKKVEAMSVLHTDSEDVPWVSIEAELGSSDCAEPEPNEPNELYHVPMELYIDDLP